MAGAKGRSGGHRPNTGGKREGAGRKPNPVPAPIVIESSDADMLDLLQKIALGLIEATPIQVRAAIAAVQYTHVKKGEGGKKDAKGRAAKDAASGRFAPASGPRLASVDGKQVASGS